IHHACHKTGTAKIAAPNAPPRPGEPDPDIVYKAEVGSSPVRGAKDAKVTIVAWSDFQCPFCAGAEATLDQVRAAYGKDVRVVWKNSPLPIHPNALSAAEAALAAGEQGRFWEMHDLLFKQQQKVDRASCDRYAKQLGLDMTKFSAAMSSHRFQREIEADAAAGAKIGAHGVPTFFINGKVLVGAQPLETFKLRIDEALRNPKPYDELMRTATAEIPGSPPPPSLKADTTIYKVDAADSPARGPRGAPVTIVEFSDFQCPFCARVEPTLAKILKQYGGKVRLVWKNYPLPFHDRAQDAALAALAAREQGRFW